MDQPETVGRYRIRSTLGQGAMGVVYLAHDPDIDRQVAVKLVRKDLLAGENGEAYLARFRQEVKAAGRCMHPNIVAIYDFGMHDGSPYFVMEFIEGVGLDRSLVGGMGPQAGSAIVLQLLEALEFAHGLGVVHRDIKPANLIITPGQRVKVMDFGISRIVSRSLTQLGSVLGTPGYMAPEQLRGDPIDLRVDIFAAGAVLHEVVRGTPPIVGRSFEEAMVRVLEPNPIELAPADDFLTEPIRAVVAKALAKNPDERFQSAAEMAEALRAAAPAGAARAQAKTVVTRPAAATPERPPDPDTLAGEADPRLEKVKSALTVFLGPIAGTLVRRQARQTRSFDGLCRTLAEAIDEPQARAEFLRRATEAAAAAAPRPSAEVRSAPAGADEDPAALEKALAQHVGPIAKLLVKRALAAGGPPDELRRRLAAHIEDAEARTRFLEGRR